MRVVGNVANNVIAEFDEEDKENIELIRRVVSGDLVPVKMMKKSFRYSKELKERARVLLKKYSGEIE